MGGSARPTSPALTRYNVLRDQGVSPEEASRTVASEFPDLETMHPELKGRVTAGPVETVGTPASEVARLKSTGPLSGRIGAALRAAPEETKRPELGRVTSGEIRKQHPWSLARGVGELAASGAVGMVTPEAADKSETSELDRLAESGVDVSKHANLLAAANLAGFLGGGLPLAGGGEAGATVGKAARAGSALLRAAAERAGPEAGRVARLAGHMGRTGATMGTLAAEGAALERQDPKTAAKNVAIQALVGAGLGGIMAPEARAIASEGARLIDRSLVRSATKEGGRPLTGSFRMPASPEPARAGALGDLQRQGPFTAAHQLEMGKVRAAELESGGPKEAPDLAPAFERKLEAPAAGRRVGAVGDIESQFPEGKSARAKGTPVEDVPLFGEPYKGEERPRMFKERDFDLSPQGMVEFDAIMGPTGTQTRVTWKDAEALASVIGARPDKILRNARDLSGEEVLALKQGVGQNVARIEALNKVANDPTAAPADQLAALGEIDRRMTDVSAMANRITKESSQKGRDLNLMKVMGMNTMDPGVFVTLGTKMKGLPLSADEMLAITKAAGERDREALHDIMTSLTTLGPWQKVMTLWKAGLLTNPKTHAVNIVGNAGMAGMETLKDYPATAVDIVLSTATGRRSKAFPSLSGVGASARQVTGPGYQAAKTVLRTGMTPADLQKWDFRNGRFGKTLGSERLGRVLDLYTQSVFRSLAAEDQLFKAAAIGRSLDEQIRVEAGNIVRAQRGKMGPNRTFAHIAKELRANVPDAMQAEAIADADFVTFNSPNKMSDFVSAGKRALGTGPGLAVAESQMPFVRTPTNVLARTLDYTPAGILRAFMPAVKMIQGEALDANQKKVAEAFGRSGTGSLLLWLGFEAARKGLATGTMPRGARDEWEVRGKTAGAVKAGDNWYTVVRMQPGGTLFTLGAQMASIADQAESPSDVIGGSAAAAGKVVADQPFLQGVTRVTEALQEPERAGGYWARSMAGSVVPAVVGAVARGTDPVRRDPKTFTEAIKARVPGLSRSVPSKLDVFGRDLPQTGGVMGQMFDVTNRSPSRETPVLKEAERLGVSLTRPGRTITVAGKTYVLSPEEYRDVQREIGPEVLRRLEAALALPGYIKERQTPERTDLAQRNRLEAAIRSAKDKTRSELSRQIYRAEKQGAEHVGTVRSKTRRF